MARSKTQGVTYRHSRECVDHDACRKNCNRDSDAPWEAWVFDKRFVNDKGERVGKKIRQRFATAAAATQWRADAMSAVRNQKLRAVDRATTQKTLAEEIDEWLAGARAGQILNKREQPYKPAVIRNYELSLRLRVTPVLGDWRLTDVTLGTLLALKEQLQGEGHSPSTVRNTFVPLQAIYRRARLQGRVQVDPTTDLPLPTAGRRERAATPDEADQLLRVLPDPEQAIWACAFYAGLRRGELRALRVRNVDLEARTIAVVASWDDKEGEIAPKSRAGTRVVPIATALVPYLEPLVDGRDGEEFVFGSATTFDARAVARKAERAMDSADKARKEAEIDPLARYTLHEARHSFSTWLDHAGVSPDRADRYMGHSSGSVSSRYRHLLPAQMAEDAAHLDAYLAGTKAGKVRVLTAAS